MQISRCAGRVPYAAATLVVRMADTNCSRCGGIGFIILERDGVTAAKPCSCAREGRAERVESAAGIPPLYRNASTENFLLPSDNPIARNSLGSVLLQVRAFVREFPLTDKPGLLFVGDPACCGRRRKQGKNQNPVMLVCVTQIRGLQPVLLLAVEVKSNEVKGEKNTWKCKQDACRKQRHHAN